MARIVMPSAVPNAHSVEMLELFMDSCKKLSQFKTETHHRVQFVSDALPVTYFGRLADPKLRVLTVGLNPARSEFDDDSLLGFCGPGKTVPYLERCTVDEARKALKAQDLYFVHKRKNQRASRYFDLLEEFLNQLGASYYDSQDYALAAHVDVWTPFAVEAQVNRADATVTKDGWERFVRVVAEARTASLLVVIGSGKDKISEFGGAKWDEHPPHPKLNFSFRAGQSLSPEDFRRLEESARPRDFYSLNSFQGRELRVIGNTSWGGQTVNVPPPPQVVQKIRELMKHWGIELGRPRRAKEF